MSSQESQGNRHYSGQAHGSSHRVPTFAPLRFELTAKEIMNQRERMHARDFAIEMRRRLNLGHVYDVKRGCRTMPNVIRLKDGFVYKAYGNATDEGSNSNTGNTRGTPTNTDNRNERNKKVLNDAFCGGFGIRSQDFVRLLSSKDRVNHSRKVLVPAELISNCQELLKRYRFGVWIDDFYQDYKNHFSQLDVRPYGYGTVMDFVKERTDIFHFVRDKKRSRVKVFDAKIPEQILERCETLPQFPDHILGRIALILIVAFLYDGRGVYLENIFRIYERAFTETLSFEEYFDTEVEAVECLMQVGEATKTQLSWMLKKKYDYTGIENSLPVPPIIGVLGNAICVCYNWNFKLPLQNLPYGADRILQLNVKVCNVVDPHEFYLHLEENVDKITTLENELNEFYDRHADEYRMPYCYIREDILCVIRYEDRWLRGIITVPVFPVVQVLVIDRGVRINVQNGGIFYLARQFSKLPCQALRATLYGIRPRDFERKQKFERDVVQWEDETINTMKAVIFKKSNTCALVKLEDFTLQHYRRVKQMKVKLMYFRDYIKSTNVNLDTVEDSATTYVINEKLVKWNLAEYCDQRFHCIKSSAKIPSEIVHMAKEFQNEQLARSFSNMPLHNAPTLHAPPGVGIPHRIVGGSHPLQYKMPPMNVQQSLMMVPHPPSQDVNSLIYSPSTPYLPTASYYQNQQNSVSGNMGNFHFNSQFIQPTHQHSHHAPMSYALHHHPPGLPPPSYGNIHTPGIQHGNPLQPNINLSAIQGRMQITRNRRTAVPITSSWWWEDIVDYASEVVRDDIPRNVYTAIRIGLVRYDSPAQETENVVNSAPVSELSPAIIEEQIEVQHPLLENVAGNNTLAQYEISSQRTGNYVNSAPVSALSPAIIEQGIQVGSNTLSQGTGNGVNSGPVSAHSAVVIEQGIQAGSSTSSQGTGNGVNSALVSAHSPGIIEQGIQAGNIPEIRFNEIAAFQNVPTSRGGAPLVNVLNTPSRLVIPPGITIPERGTANTGLSVGGATSNVPTTVISGHQTTNRSNRRRRTRSQRNAAAARLRRTLGTLEQIAEEPTTSSDETVTSQRDVVLCPTTTASDSSIISSDVATTQQAVANQFSLQESKTNSPPRSDNSVTNSAAGCDGSGVVQTSTTGQSWLKETNSISKGNELRKTNSVSNDNEVINDIKENQTSENSAKGTTNDQESQCDVGGSVPLEHGERDALKSQCVTKSDVLPDSTKPSNKGTSKELTVDHNDGTTQDDGATGGTMYGGNIALDGDVIINKVQQSVTDAKDVDSDIAKKGKAVAGELKSSMVAVSESGTSAQVEDNDEYDTADDSDDDDEFVTADEATDEE